ncbi:hypothetical protein [Salinigranum sp.]|uniref:hypothetical protein n=1 Tax=Salinigranum sp. TaxID=1966351 RepID=UPI003568BDE4
MGIYEGGDRKCEVSPAYAADEERMRRRACLSGTATALTFGLAGCTETGLGQQCHSGHHGPPKGVEVTNHATGKRTISIAAYDVESESAEPVFSQRTMMRPGEERTYREVATEPGRHRVVVEMESLSGEWTETTEQCGIWLLLVDLYDDRIEARRPGSM